MPYIPFAAALSDGTVVLDANGNMQWRNAAARLLGLYPPVAQCTPNGRTLVSGQRVRLLTRVLTCRCKMTRKSRPIVDQR